MGPDMEHPDDLFLPFMKHCLMLAKRGGFIGSGAHHDHVLQV